MKQLVIPSKDLQTELGFWKSGLEWDVKDWKVRLQVAHLAKTWGFQLPQTSESMKCKRMEIETGFPGKTNPIAPHVLLHKSCPDNAEIFLNVLCYGNVKQYWKWCLPRIRALANTCQAWVSVSMRGKKHPELVDEKKMKIPQEDAPPQSPSGGCPSTVNSLQMWESSYFIVYLIEQYWRLICFINILSCQMLWALICWKQAILSNIREESSMREFAANTRRPSSR